MREDETCKDGGRKTSDDAASDVHTRDRISRQSFGR